MKHAQNHDDIEHIDLSQEEPLPLGNSRSVNAVEAREDYKKFGLVLGSILLVAVMLTTIRGWTLSRFMCDFMAVFFMAFAAFKFWDIESFVQGYRKYDLVASRFRPWAYTLPFLGAGIGFWYLMSEGPLRLNLLVLLVAGVAVVGALREVNSQARPRQSFLGNIIRLPLAKVSLVENTTIFIMACLVIVF